MFKLEWHGKETLDAIIRATNQALEEGAGMVGGEAKSMVPVKTGALRDSIRVEKSRFSDGGFLVKAGGSGAYHANLVELGTKNMQARPFLRPALHKSEGKIKEMVASRVAGALK